MEKIIRYFLIIRKLSGLNKYVCKYDMLRYLTSEMSYRGFGGGDVTQRTLQRDFKDMRTLFGVDIQHRKDFGYYIASLNNDELFRYEEILVNFDILTALNKENRAFGYILPEHHRPRGSENLPLLIKALKEDAVIRFDYWDIRQDAEYQCTVSPYFLKESLGLWYLVAQNSKGNLRNYGVDRISNLQLTGDTFRRDATIDSDSLYKDSFGIWDDPAMPVEEIVLRYSPLDGRFLKNNPLHSSQQILIDNDEEFLIRLSLKITNDFVMALLSRSTSLTVISPQHLRERVKNIYEEALTRNK